MPLTAQGLLFAESDIATQLALLVAWAGLWLATLGPFARRCVKPFLLSRRWKDQWVALARKYYKDTMFIEFQTSEEALDFACGFVSLLCQHAVGGALCLPAVLGPGGPVATAMACHGALCEAGWELQDVIERSFSVAFRGPEAMLRNPKPVLLILALHHGMGLGMVLPMNMTYANSPHYHEFVFLLQAATFFAMFSQLYGWTLDVSRRGELRQMQACAGCTAALLVWTRVLRFTFLGHSLVSAFLADGNEQLARAGCLVLCMMGVLNVIFTVDSVDKFWKFARMRAPMDEAESKKPWCADYSGLRRIRLPSLLGLSAPAKEHQK